jgi:8-oxo-dGTP pyrophosphatase MutT (NUDIX family)
MDKELRRGVQRRRVADRTLIGAGAVIYCKSTHRYLFLLRNNGTHAGTWGLAGGKIEAGESVVAGLTREMIEELGGFVKDAKLIPIEKFTSENNNFEYHTYVIRVDEEFVPILNSEHRGYCWVPLDDYPKPLHPGVWRSFKFSSVINKIRTLENL